MTKSHSLGFSHRISAERMPLKGKPTRINILCVESLKYKGIHSEETCRDYRDRPEDFHPRKRPKMGQDSPLISLMRFAFEEAVSQAMSPAATSLTSVTV